MFAVVQHAFGPASVLSYEEVPDPEPEAGQVRIAVRAAGVHLLDTGIRAGQPGPMPSPAMPFIGGREVAGVVDSVGPDVSSEWLGRRVVAHLGAASAGYAELAVAGTGSLHVLPEGKDDAAAVAMIGTGRTAMGILGWASLTASDVVLVTSAAGGLGVLLVQAALDAGAVVVGAAGGPSKVERVRRSGVAVAVDYDEPGWAGSVRSALGERAEGEREVTVVLDGIGGERGRAALELLGPDGRFLVYGWSSGEPTRLGTDDLVRLGITASVAIGPRMMRRPGGLRGLEEASLEALSSGRLVPVVTSFRLADAAAAHEALENRGTVGKVVLIP